LLYAVPTPRHLFGLKSVLYEKPYENLRKQKNYIGFKFVKMVTVEGKITLKSNEMIENLFSMTPYYWKTPEEGAKALEKCETLDTEIGFDILVYEKL
ncbi:MAG: 50S rRNA methyltransferase, partial [Oscillospiraceae bacterium]